MEVLGEPDARKRASLGSVGRGWCSWATRTRPLTLHTSRKNRPDQQTFCCQVCGFKTHADHNAAVNLSRRVGDKALQACRGRDAIKALLMKRHEQWKKDNGKETVPKHKKQRNASRKALVA